ncbi:MAG: nitrate reductase cytochrome c-type subunit [Gammaproteobacteria bacterium]|nr:nitrate reductase cytochrome c-type subunit [Gammaproteobacteria bacterium]
MLGIILVMLLSQPLAMAQDGGLVSLRGDKAVSDSSVEPRVAKIRHDSEPILRQYVQQPPLIPHRVDGYVINKKFNKCLTCHSWANYKQSGATKISQTHFVNQEGVELSNVAGRRYFCMQCHVPQYEVDPLVGNTFKPIPLLDRD